MINIREKFLQLTSNRTPKGLEDSVIKLIPEFSFEKDEFGNYYIIIKKSDGTFSDTMFTSHLDTIDRGPGSYWQGKKWNVDTKQYEEVDPKDSDDGLPIKHVFEGDFVKTDGKTNLGADDKAGVTIMLNLMSENVPGLYYFFMGEESGCVGSSSLSRVFDIKVKDGKLPRINRCISFDRKGYDSVITKQMGSTCCSDDFAKELSSKINEYGFWYKPDDGGVYTDSAEFIDIIPECSNLSVGYFSEHTTSEKQDIEFLELLSVVLTKIDWDSLKVVRDITNITYKGKKSTYGKYSNWGWEDGYYDTEYYGGHRHVVNPTTTVYTKGDTTSGNHYVDLGKGNTSKLPKKVEVNDEEFDKWYLEQKNKGWTVETTQTEPIKTEE